MTLPTKLNEYWTSGENSPALIELSTVVGRSSGVAIPQLVSKRWGGELIYKNDAYCMKMLIINPHQQTSMHLHVQKEETLLVVSGTLTIEFIARDGTKGKYTLNPGNAMTVAPGFPHQLIAGDSQVILVEASTFDHATDSVRVGM